MSKHILHLAESVLLGEELSHESLADLLKLCIERFLDKQHYHLELTTTDGQFFAGMSMDELDRLLFRQSDFLDSITLSRTSLDGSESVWSMAIYFSLINRKTEVSFTLITTSEEVSDELRGFIVAQLATLKEQFESNTSAPLSTAFWFDTQIPPSRLFEALDIISEGFPHRHSPELQILTRKNDLLIFDQKELNIARNVIRKGDQLWVCYFLNGDHGGYFRLQLTFITNLGGYAVVEGVYENKELLQRLNKSLLKLMELDAAQEASLKQALAKHPAVYDSFILASGLQADGLLNAVQSIASRLLETQPLRILHYQPPAFEEAGPITIPHQNSDLEAFRKRRSGLLWAFKIQKPDFRFYLLFNFQSSGPPSLFVYISLRSEKENLKALEVVRARFSDQRSDEATQVTNSLQEAFSFDPTLSFQEISNFLDELSKEYLQEEILKTRVSLVDGSSTYYYGADYVAIQKAMEAQTLEALHISLKEASSKHLSIHLHFTQKVDGSNGFFSIALDEPEANLIAKAFLLKHLKAESAISARRRTKEKSRDSNFLENTFSFDFSISPEILTEFIQELNQAFLPDKKMSIRVMTDNQEEFYLLDHELSRLETLLHRDQIAFIYLQKGQSHKEKLSIYLQFHGQGGDSGHYSIQGKNEEASQQLRRMILSTLGDQSTVQDILPIKADEGSFYFPENISGDQLIVLLNTMARKFFTKESFIQNKRFNFNIRDNRGKSYSNLGATEFRNLFTSNPSLINTIAVSTLARSGKFVEINFNLTPGKENPGNYTLQLGTDDKNDTLKEFLDTYFPKPKLPKKEDTISLEEAAQSQENQDKKTDPPKKLKAPRSTSLGNTGKTANLIFGSSAEKATKVEKLLMAFSATHFLHFKKIRQLEEVKAISLIKKDLENTGNFVADLSEPSPELFLTLGLCIEQKIPILLLYKKVDELPLSFTPYNKILYSETEKGLARLKVELELHLKL